MTNKPESNFSIKSFSFQNIEVPQFAERPNSNGWINFGDTNDYPNYLIGLSNRSARHSAILKNKANMIGGNGWQKGNLSTQAITFLKNASNEMDLDDILARISYDYELFGAFALNLIWSKDRTRIAEINYINPKKVRIAIPDDNYPDKENYFVCDDWRNTRKNIPVFYPGFSTIDRDEASTILYVKQVHSADEYYGIPTYLPCVNFCELDDKLSLFHLNNVNNGFSPSMIVNFNSEPSDEEKDDEINRLRRMYEGASNAGKVIFTFSDGKDNAPIITPVNLNDSDQKYKDLNDTIESNIFQAHQVTNPNLMGVLSANKISSGTNEMIEAMTIFQSMYVDHKQAVIQKVFNKIAAINEIPDKLIIEKYNLKIVPVLEVKDIMMVLDSTITNEQKQATFELLGLTRDEALKLCPSTAPTPELPVKVNPAASVTKP